LTHFQSIPLDFDIGEPRQPGILHRPLFPWSSGGF